MGFTRALHARIAVCWADRVSAPNAVTDYYERYWRDGFWADNPYERWKLERVRAHLGSVRRGARVLDVGCGDGRVLAELAPLGFRGCGLDVSDHALEQARARGIEGKRADIDGGTLPVETGAFEVVLCLDVLEHLFAPEQLLREMARVVTPGGTLIAAVPNGLNLFNRLSFLAGRHVDVMDKAHLSSNPFSEHLRFFSRDVFESFLAAGGFRPCARDYFFPDRLTDARFRAAQWLARAVTGPRLHERIPTLFALEFLFACERAPGGPT
jgi:SAM-dependent methyltransferase